MLFETFKRTDSSFMDYRENPFDFYNRSSSAEVATIRELIEDWYKDYPHSGKKHLHGLFKGDFDAAFFELFMFTLFNRNNFTVSLHPELYLKSTKPDFCLKRNYLEWYVEAKIVKNVSEGEEKKNRVMDAIEHELNKIKSPNFFFHFKHTDFEYTGKGHPPLTNCKEFIENELQNRNPDEVERLLKEEGLNCEYVNVKYEKKGLKLILGLIPKAKKFRGDANVRPIGLITRGEAKFVTTHEAIKISLQKKASKYGSFDKPFIIALNSISPTGTDAFEIEKALFGDPGFLINVNTGVQEGSYRSKNGAFHQDFMKNVSAVFITRLYPSNIHEAEYSFYINPNAINSINLLETDYSCNYFDRNDKYSIKKGKSIAELLK